MKINSFKSFLISAAASGLLAGFAPGTLSLQAGEVQIPNSNFDSSTISWSWENWSAAGSAVRYDASLNAAGGGSPSGSLLLTNNFGNNAAWQQAVYTLQLPAEVNARELYSQISFDVKVDPSSTPRAEGDYGSVQVILRNGNNWDWAELGFISLLDTNWVRVTYRLTGITNLIDSIRALTLQVAQNGFLGPVTLNIDNIAWTEEVVVADFNNGNVDVPPDGWAWENWSASGSGFGFDPLDYYGRQTSGSLRLTNNFVNNPGGYQQAVFTYTLPAQVNAGIAYSHVNLDIKVDPSSTPRAAGDYGFFEIILRNGGNWDWVATGPPTTSGTRLTDTNWVRISMPIRSGNQVHRLTLKLGENALLGPVILNVDNISWIENTAPPPPPSLSLTKAKAGLNLVATSTDQYGRHNIYSLDNSTLGWSDWPEPMSYSLNLLTFPNSTDFAGFQAHMFLVPGSPGSATSPDWNELTLIYLDIKAGANGSGNATFRWKTNQTGNDGGNNQLFAGGLSNLSSATVLGTWTVTVNQTTNFTVMAPDGGSMIVTLAPEAAALFAGPIRVYVGVQPNASANIGQSASIGSVQVMRGATVLLEDNFSGDALDESKWVANASAGGVQVVPAAEAGFLVSWGLPDSGFILQSAPSLSPGTTWTDSTAVPVNLGPLRKQVNMPRSSLPSTNQGYFRLSRPQ